MKKRKSILLCSSNSYPYVAGDGISAMNFAIELKKKYQHTSILTLNFNKKNASKSIHNGIKIFRIPFENNIIIDKIKTRIVIFPLLVYHIFFNDVILIYGTMICFKTIIVLARLFGKKVIFRSTLNKYDDIETICEKSFCNKTTLSLISGYFSINPIFTKSFKKVFSKKNKIFEYCQGVNIEKFAPVDENKKLELRKKLNLPHHDRIIITTGNLFKRKGFDEIFEQLQKSENDFLYLVVGNHQTFKDHFLYKQKEEIEELFEKGNKLLKDKIQFINPVEEIEEYLQTADLFLFNSSQEGVPNSLLEAMSCALPCVCREIEETKNYITFNGKNSLTFSDANEINSLIKKIFTDENLEKSIGNNARNFIVENYNISKVADKFIEKFV